MNLLFGGWKAYKGLLHRTMLSYALANDYGWATTITIFH